MLRQRENIRQLFLSHPGQDIPLPEVMKFAAQYNARVLELRREGMRIVNHKTKVNGEWHSWFRYEPMDAIGQQRFA